MAVNANGKMAGSIGGGIMEYKFVELAKERLQVQHTSLQIKKQVHDASATTNRSGMICSGEQKILIYPFHSNDVLQIENIVNSLEQNKNGMLELSPIGIRFSPNNPGFDHYFEFTSEENWLYREKTGYKNNLYIIGGGHCALSLSRIMGMMDFHIQLFDERKDLNTLEANHWVHEKIMLNRYDELKEKIFSDPKGYVVVMTIGYRKDEIALKALINKDFKYLGLLGSRKKIEEMFEQLRREGVEESLLNRIHSPIGLSIKSQTPEEIAVSIAAEIISIKNA